MQSVESSAQGNSGIGNIGREKIVVESVEAKNFWLTAVISVQGLTK
jgi:hypothetical protein